MAKIWVLQHHPAEGLGAVADALQSAALAWQYVRTFDGQSVPKDMKGAGGLIVMGGPMGVYEQDRYPFLRDEIRLIESALCDNKPILGVCLGSQLLAAALRARVTKGPGKEIGWYPVHLEPAAHDDRLFGGVPKVFTPCHWHGDVFELPTDAVALASSEKTPCQAFRYSQQAYGILFHMELSEPIIAQWVQAFARDLIREKLDGEKILADAVLHAPAIEPIAETVFGRWASAIQGTPILRGL